MANNPNPAPADSLPRLLVDSREARRLLGGVCEKTLFNLRKSGALGYVQIGSRVMYRMTDLIAFAERGAVRP